MIFFYFFHGDKGFNCLLPYTGLNQGTLRFDIVITVGGEYFRRTPLLPLQYHVANNTFSSLFFFRYVLCGKDSVIFFILQEKGEKIIHIKITKSEMSMFSLSNCILFAGNVAYLQKTKK